MTGRIIYTDPQRCSLWCLICGDLNLCRSDRRCSHKNIIDQSFISYIQPGLPVQPAVGQIIDYKAKWRYDRILCGIQTDSNLIIAGMDEICDFGTKSRIAAAVDGSLLAVDVQCGDMCRSVKLEKYSPVLKVRQGQHSPVAADHLVTDAVRIVKRDLLTGVGQANLLSLCGKTEKFIAPFLGKFPVITNTVSHTSRSFNPCIIISIISSRSEA